MALAQSSKKKGLRMFAGWPKRKVEATGGIAAKCGLNTQIEVGRARDEFSCLQVGLGSRYGLVLEGFLVTSACNIASAE